MAGFAQIEAFPGAVEHVRSVLFDPSDSLAYAPFGDWVGGYRDWSDPANAGAVAGDTTARAGAAPDISQLSPRERFDRLFNRIMQAAEQGDTAQVRRFTPMALGAYAQLDTIDADAR